ncbi:hypothetical protein [Lacticaseibacillus paracasei]
MTGTNKAWADSQNVPEIYVTTMTENGADVDDLASNVFKSWGIGQSSSDSGICNRWWIFWRWRSINLILEFLIKKLLKLENNNSN